MTVYSIRLQLVKHLDNIQYTATEITSHNMRQKRHIHTSYPAVVFDLLQ